MRIHYKVLLHPDYVMLWAWIVLVYGRIRLGWAVPPFAVASLVWCQRFSTECEVLNALLRDRGRKITWAEAYRAEDHLC